MLSESNWNEINVGTVALTQGANKLKCTVKSGSADVDWIQLSPSAIEQRASSEVSTELPTR
jgi:hypothetical protein